ncbi:MAG: LacI family DNA-binding transcriptional regulator [Clostridiales bacterium]|nr:LacI family DNA-binding transcriptional regulator [Clostridiales bacterium]
MTINEIAKMAGVSNAAVSRYLNGGSLSQEKRERIKAVIDETGYQPDTYAQMLRTRKVRQIGVIVPKINSTAVAEATAGISDVLNRENYMFLLANTDNDEKKELEYLSLFGANRAAGVILLATVITPEHEEMLSHMRIPVVLVGQRHRQFPCVYHNDYEAARELDELVLKKGRRHIGYIGVTQRDIAVGYLRRKALVDACREYGIAEDEICFAEGDFGHSSGYEQGRLLLERDPALDAIICATDTAAVGVIQTARQMGRRVPEDLSVVGIGDSWPCQVVEPALTTAHYFYEESGREAARMMLSLLEGEGNGPVRQTMLGYELKLRDSL